MEDNKNVNSEAEAGKVDGNGTGQTERTFTQAEALLKFKGTQPYPDVPDAGENKPAEKKSVGSQFADWFDAAMK